MIKIHDIKPIVEIPDNTIYIYYTLIVTGLLLSFLILYLIYKFFKSKKITDDKIYFEKLKRIDFKELKESSYNISKYGRVLAKDERQKRLIEELHNSLEQFKYKKTIPNTIPINIKQQFETFMESLDVR
ncbi:MAG: hypothetical protein U9R37_01125 [Campylobacterota bacterium]|nr:hypothetical protein [Campylobacterota bacterium]